MPKITVPPPTPAEVEELARWLADACRRLCAGKRWETYPPDVKDRHLKVAEEMLTTPPRFFRRAT